MGFQLRSRVQVRLCLGVAALLVGLPLSATSAHADCVLSGQTVTCSGLDADGFDAGALNNLTVNVQPLATVNDNGTATIILNDTNTVTNNGTLTTVNPGANGIIFGDFNLVTNNATIVIGASGFGLVGADNNVVVNNGTIVAGISGFGIFAGVNNTITNAATGVITVGDGASGIFVAGNSTVTNAGAITIGNTFGPAAGIFAINDFNTLVNAAGATITGGDGAAGLAVQGNDAKVTNAGTITVRDSAPGILVQGDRAIVTNTGTIVARDDSAGISVLGDSITIINRGTITVRNVSSATATGIESFSLAGSNSIINTGTINVGTNATGISVSGDGTVFNSGAINAATGSAAIEFCACSVNSSLTLGPGSSIQGLVIGSGVETFQLGGTGKDTFNLSLIGAGLQYDGFATFNKVDSSNWTVIGTGAQDWNVLGGTLTVNGTIAGIVTVNAGGTLAGTGTTGDTAVNSGGIFAPGNGTAGSSLNVANLAFQSGALYMVQLNSTTSSFANVAGNADLSGIVGVSLTPGSNVIKQYTIMTTGSHNGTFSGVNAPGGLVGSISFDPTHVFLTFALDFGAKFGLNVNQQNVANAATNFFNANGTIPAAFASLTPAGLTQVSGELATGSQQATFDAMNLFLSLLTDPFIDGRGGVGGNTGATPFTDEGADAYAANKQDSARSAFAKFATKADVARNDLLDPHWSVWGSAFGGGSNTSGNATLGSQSATARAFGLAAGADYRISPDTLVGFALAGGGTNFSVAGFGTGRSDLFQAGAFVRRNFGAAYVTAAAAYGWQDVTTDRTVTAAGIDRLRAEFNANAWSGRVEAGYRFATPWMGITPYAAGQFTAYSLPAYAEQVLSGAGTFALNYAAKDVTASRSEFGVRTDKSFAMQNAILTLRGRVAWAHDFNTDRNVTALFQTLPGASFVVNGAAQAHDSALVTGAAEMKWVNGFSLAGTFEGQFSNVTNSYAGKGVVRYSW
ncbi:MULTISPECIES: autotransporter outer membrane beta-barrel domain-containing protein [Bradyrhizobium]|uniref:autotransporter outer membrane beta-barrel domain-containing protein n=1 Tax=Bradyrhizobium TaxID=374 RepID=UPI001FCD6E83|nr:MULTISPECIES: autotransporter domain-containing protein [Bradyrhizobium]